MRKPPHFFKKNLHNLKIPKSSKGKIKLMKKRRTKMAKIKITFKIRNNPQKKKNQRRKSKQIIPIHHKKTQKRKLQKRKF